MVKLTVSMSHTHYIVDPRICQCISKLLGSLIIFCKTLCNQQDLYLPMFACQTKTRHLTSIDMSGSVYIFIFYLLFFPMLSVCAPVENDLLNVM